MKLELFKTLWGYDGDAASAAELASSVGFAGVEGPAPPDEAARERFFRQLDGVPWIAEVTTCTPLSSYLPLPHLSVEQHLASLDEGVRRSLPGKPRFITTMAGSDEWGFDDVLAFHRAVIDLEQKHSIAISTETHRGRPTFHPWQTRRLLEKLPDLRLTCDFSHWCVVSERLVLDEHPALLDLCAAHVHHIHGRVGYAQGPQVPDPRAPEYHLELDAHERWWKTLWQAMRLRGFEITTFTPESGPDGYLHLQPFTQTPVADLWEINRWLGLRQLSRFTAS